MIIVPVVMPPFHCLLFVDDLIIVLPNVSLLWHLYLCQPAACADFKKACDFFVCKLCVLTNFIYYVCITLL